METFNFLSDKNLNILYKFYCMLGEFNGSNESANK